MNENEIVYLNQLLIECPDETDAINTAIELTEAEDYAGLSEAFSGYVASTPCRTNLMASVDRILLGAKA